MATFAEESKLKYAELCELWLAHLYDNIFSVRHHSALALCTVYQGSELFREDLMAKFSKHIDENLLKAKE